jgi:hypothetical protein
MVGYRPFLTRADSPPHLAKVRFPLDKLFQERCVTLPVIGNVLFLALGLFHRRTKKRNNSPRARRGVGEPAVTIKVNRFLERFQAYPYGKSQLGDFS